MMLPNTLHGLMFFFSLLVLCRVANVRNSKFIKAFGRNIYRIRYEKGISQGELANRADMPINQIGRIERGEVNTTISTVLALSRAFEVNFKTLFEFDFEEAPPQ
jgi:DNA-binding XRE family transcriptional regulator